MAALGVGNDLSRASLPISRRTAFRIEQTAEMFYVRNEMAPVRTVKASPLSNAKVIKRVTVVARAIAKKWPHRQNLAQSKGSGYKVKAPSAFTFRARMIGVGEKTVRETFSQRPYTWPDLVRTIACT